MTDRPDNIILQQHGDLQPGYFYELLIEDDEWLLKAETEAIAPYRPILSPRTPTQDELLLQNRSYIDARWAWDDDGPTEHEERRECPLNSEHVTAQYWKNVRVELSGGPDVSAFVHLASEGDLAVVVTSALATALRDTGFSGMRLKEREIDPGSRYRVDPGGNPPQFYELQFMGKKCFRPLSIVNAPNECPWCGKSPLICEGCGHMDLSCCGGKCPWVPRPGHKGERDERLIAGRPGFVDWRPAIIEASLWDGSDFIFGGISKGLREHVVTKRVVDWLLSVHAAPFYARPVLVNVEGADNEKLERLKVISGK